MLAGRAPAAPNIGEPTGFVNDRAGVLDSSQIQSLEVKLRSVATSDSPVQICILTVKSLEGLTVEDYAQKVFDLWKPGQEGVDNGLLFLVATSDRKVRIHTGKGVEGVLPDIVCGQIIRHEILPLFRGGDYAGGIRQGCDAIIGVTRGEIDPGAKWSSSNKNTIVPALIIFIIIAIGVISSIFNKRRGYRRGGFFIFGGGSSGRSGGGGFGGFGGFGGGCSGGGGASGGW